MIFIAYETDSGLEHARALRKDLNAVGLKSFVAHEDLPGKPGGYNWISKINEYIYDAAVMVVLLTPKALLSEEVFGEWTLMQTLRRQGKTKEVVPIFLDGTQPSALPPNWISISLYQAVPFNSDWREVAKKLEERTAAVTGGFLPSRIQSRINGTVTLLYKDCVIDTDDEIVDFKNGPDKVNELWQNIRSKLFIVLYRRYSESEIVVERRTIQFPEGDVAFTYEKDDHSFFGERSSYGTTLSIRLSLPPGEILEAMLAALWNPTNYVIGVNISSATDINALFGHASNNGVDILGFEPRVNLRAKLPVERGEVFVQAASCQTEITVTLKNPINFDRFEPTLIMRWLGGEEVMADLLSILEPKMA